MATTSPIKSKKQIRQLAEHFRLKGEFRNYALVVVCAHTALRISDVLALRWCDVYDFERNRLRSEITLCERKTGKPKTIKLHAEVVRALLTYMTCGKTERSGYIFRSRKGENKAIGRVQAYRIIRAASEALLWEFRASCHSLRKTFGYHAWQSGVSPVLIMEIYNHSSFSVTRRYLGVGQDEKNSVYSGLDLLGR